MDYSLHRAYSREQMKQDRENMSQIQNTQTMQLISVKVKLTRTLITVPKWEKVDFQL